MGAKSPLSFWNDTAAKRSIIEFVERTTRADAPDFVPDPDRVAVFDNDGTLWPEAPLPFQVAYVLDELRGGRPPNRYWPPTPWCKPRSVATWPH